MNSDKKINCHFVPQFILKNFNRKISCFNVKTGEYLFERNPKKIFSIGNLYPEELEKRFCDSMERDFSKLLKEKILDKDIVTITREEIRIIKRFLVMGMLRTPDNLDTVHKMRAIFRNMHFPLSNIILRRFSKEIEFDESDEDYWVRTIECILDNKELSSKNILNNEKATYLAFHFARVMEIGYLGFWDAPSETDEFLITDIGMTSENEIGWHADFLLNHKKKDTLTALEMAMKDKSGTSYEQIQLIKNNLLFFHENFMMFPISSKKMIVLINPFFKILDLLKIIGLPYPEMKNYTKLTDERLFRPNEGQRLMTDPEDVKKPTDVFTYHPVKMSPSDCQYCNALFMDRVHTWLGFGNMEKIKGSVLRYRKENEGFVPRNNYDVLYHILSNCKSDE